MVLVGGESPPAPGSISKRLPVIRLIACEGSGYVHSDMGFDANSCAVLSAIGKQSPDINRGVDAQTRAGTGAGDEADVLATRQMKPTY